MSAFLPPSPPCVRPVGWAWPPTSSPKMSLAPSSGGLPSCLVPPPVQEPASLPVPTLWSNVHLNEGAAHITPDRDARAPPSGAGPVFTRPLAHTGGPLSSGARLLPRPPPPAHPAKSQGPAPRRVSQRELPCVYRNMDI